MQRVDRFSQAYKQAPWRRQVQFVMYFLLLVVIIALIASLYVSVTANSSTIGRNIQAVQATMAVEEQDISRLRGNIGVLYSSQEMESRARSLGFGVPNPEDRIYIAIPGYTARPPANLAPAYQNEVVRAESLPPEYTESLLLWLLKQFNQSIFPLFKVQ
jgi:cell division protein FtsL